MLLALFPSNPTTEICAVRYRLCGTAGYQKLKTSQRIVASLCNHGWNGKLSSKSEVMPLPVTPRLELVWNFFLFPSLSSLFPLVFLLLLISHNSHLLFPVFKVMYIKVASLLKVMTPLGIKTMWGCLF